MNVDCPDSNTQFHCKNTANVCGKTKTSYFLNVFKVLQKY